MQLRAINRRCATARCELQEGLVAVFRSQLKSVEALLGYGGELEGFQAREVDTISALSDDFVLKHISNIPDFVRQCQELPGDRRREVDAKCCSEHPARVLK